VTIEAPKMPYDRAKLHHAKANLYQEFEPEGEKWHKICVIAEGKMSFSRVAVSL